MVLIVSGEVPCVSKFKRGSGEYWRTTKGLRGRYFLVRKMWSGDNATSMVDWSCGSPRTEFIRRKLEDELEENW